MKPSSPYSPDTKLYVSSSLDAWNKFFSVTNNSSDSDSSPQKFMPLKYSGSSSGGTDSDTMYPMARTPALPPQFRRCAPSRPRASLGPSSNILGSSPSQNSQKSTPSKRRRSRPIWGKRKTKAKASKATGHAVDNGATASAAPEYPDGWAPLNAEDLHESWSGAADEEYIQDMYTQSMDPANYDWDGVEDRLLEDAPEEL